MQYGLIGEKLIHSFSKEIHEKLCGYEYELCPLKKEELEDFFKRRDFKGINVTIPYKTEVIKYLDSIDEAAEIIGAVNTVVNRDGKLIGFNTDAFGLQALLEKNSINLKDRKVLILGSGGTSKTALYVAKSLGAKEAFRVSRTDKSGFITYDEAKKLHCDAAVIINTTPCGMFPNSNAEPVDLSAFAQLEAVVDVIYNPLRTRLIINASDRGVTATGGLYMLVMQAYKAAELFLNEKVDICNAEDIYQSLVRHKQNIVLIGMPSSGKTTVGKLLSKKLDMPFFDSDEAILDKTGLSPAEIIKTKGEAAFRQIESEVIEELSRNNHTIIATGGGAVTVKENVLSLKSNGKLYFIDRPVSLLTPTADRPLSSSYDALAALYEKRKQIYESAADERIANTKDINFVVENIKKDCLL